MQCAEHQYVSGTPAPVARARKGHATKCRQAQGLSLKLSSVRVRQHLTIQIVTCTAGVRLEGPAAVRAPARELSGPQTRRGCKRAGRGTSRLFVTSCACRFYLASLCWLESSVAISGNHKVVPDRRCGQRQDRIQRHAGQQNQNWWTQFDEKKSRNQGNNHEGEAKKNRRLIFASGNLHLWSRAGGNSFMSETVQDIPFMYYCIRYN